MYEFNNSGVGEDRIGDILIENILIKRCNVNWMERYIKVQMIFLSFYIYVIGVIEGEEWRREWGRSFIKNKEWLRVF